MDGFLCYNNREVASQKWTSWLGHAASPDVHDPVPFGSAARLYRAVFFASKTATNGGLFYLQNCSPWALRFAHRASTARLAASERSSSVSLEFGKLRVARFLSRDCAIAKSIISTGDLFGKFF